MQQAIEAKEVEGPKITLNHQPLVYAQISSHLQRAVVVPEDAALPVIMVLTGKRFCLRWRGTFRRDESWPEVQLYP